MNAKRKRWFEAAAGRRWVAGLLFSLFLTVLAMAQFETLHRFIHPDAAQASHQCAVTMLTHGQVDTPLCEVVVAAVAPIPATVQFTDDAFISTVDCSLPPSCGPPAIPS